MVMKIFTQNVCILCRNRERKCVAASEHIFYVSANVWLLLGVFQCFLKNVQLLLKDINLWLLLKENVQLFFVWWLLLETFQCFLINVRLLLKDINERLLLKEKKCAFKNYVHLRNYFKVKQENDMRCNNRDDLLQLSFKISIFSEAYI